MCLLVLRASAQIGGGALEIQLVDHQRLRSGVARVHAGGDAEHAARYFVRDPEHVLLVGEALEAGAVGVVRVGGDQHLAGSDGSTLVFERTFLDLRALIDRHADAAAEVVVLTLREPAHFAHVVLEEIQDHRVGPGRLDRGQHELAPGAEKVHLAVAAAAGSARAQAQRDVVLEAGLERAAAAEAVHERLRRLECAEVLVHEDDALGVGVVLRTGLRARAVALREGRHREHGQQQRRGEGAQGGEGAPAPGAALSC